MFYEERTESSRQAIQVEDDMLICKLKPELIIDIENARVIVCERQDFTKGKIFPTMVIIDDDYLLFERDAFEYFSSADGLANVSAMAIVMKSPLRKILTNFSLLFYKHLVPLRLFTSEAKAKVWLFGYMKEALIREN